MLRPLFGIFRHEAMRLYFTYSSYHSEPCGHEGISVMYASAVNSFRGGKRRHVSAESHIRPCSLLYMLERVTRTFPQA